MSTRRRSNRMVRALGLALSGLTLLASAAGAQKVLEKGSDLHALAKESARLTMAPDVARVEDARAAVRIDADMAALDFASRQGGRWSTQVDKRTGQISNLDGSGVPFFPGRGNNLK